MDSVSIIGKKCTGCSSCVFSCPKHAITFKEDILGFYFPNVDFKKCINCGNCLAKCPVYNTSNFLRPLNVFAADAIVKNADSSSGGIATTLISSFVSSGGIAYCTQFSKEKQIFTFERFSKEFLPERISGSRYVQSNVSNSFSLCKFDLKAGLDVLFLGTPCQVDGLIHFLNKPYKNLITIDIFCHGVPSQKMFFNHLNNNKIEKPYDNVLFRNRTKYSVRVSDYRGKKLYESQEKKDLFLEGFQNGRILRDSCFVCKYSKIERVSDISLGDFWGKSVSNSIGDSLILINTNKGFSFLGQFKEQINSVPLLNDIKNITKNNPALRKPTKKSFYRRLFVKNFQKNCDFDKSVIMSRSLKKKIVELVRRTKIKKNRKKTI